MCCLRVAPHKGTRADQKTVDVHGKISLKKVCCFLLTQRYNEVKFLCLQGLIMRGGCRGKGRGRAGPDEGRSLLGVFWDKLAHLVITCNCLKLNHFTERPALHYLSIE